MPQRFLRLPHAAYVAAFVGAGLVLAMTAPAAVALSPFIAVTFVFAVLVAAVLGGGRPGLLCTCLIVFGWHFTFGRGFSRSALDPRYLLMLLTFLTVGAVISVLCEALMQAWRRITERQRMLELEIVERRRAERESQDRAENLRVTLASIGDAVITTNVASKITTMNAVAETLTGWSASEAANQPLSDVFRIINEHTRTRVENPCDKVLKHGTVVDLANHTLLIARDGREIPIDDSAAPIHDSSGRIFGVVLVFRDATREREATVALQQLASIVDNSDDAIIGKTVDGIITSWNSAAERLYGLTAAEAIGQHIEIIVPAESRDEHKHLMKQLAGGQRIDQLDTVRQRKDGSLVHLSQQISPIRDVYGKVIGASTIARDVTQRKSTEEALAVLARTSAALASLTDRENALRRAVDSVVPFFADWCVAMTLDDDGVLREPVGHHWDPQKQSVLDDLLKSYRWDWNSPAISMQAMRTGKTQLLENVTEDVLTKIAQDDAQRELLHGLHPRSMMSVPLDIRNKTIGTISFMLSDTSRRYTQRDVRFAEDLAKRVATAIDNAELLESLRAADRQKDEFLAMLAHELRNPLAAISYANNLIPLSDVNAQGELLGVVDRQLHNLTHLIDGLLDVSRISRDKIQLRHEQFDASALIRRVADVFRPLMAEKGHRFSADIPPDPIPLYADVTRVEQILTNVLANAIKYTQDGGQISLTATTRDNYVDIKVKDSGIGIAKEMLPRIFDLFSQAEQGLDRSQGGLGIGLTIARKLTEIHGGVLKADSDGIGHGAVFTIRLPLTHERPRDAVASDRQVPTTNAKLRILVVDDNRDTVHTQSMYLSSLGHRVETALDGPTAVGAALSFRPHVVLLDLGLPRMNGYEVAKELRSQGFRNELIIAISGYNRPEDKRQCDEAGFDYHFAKPVDQNALLKILNAVDVRGSESVGQCGTSD